ncbi:MAG: methylenetetrahydrofolate reductase [NAD(P)H] [Puniceicoccales bacterium]
MGMNFFRNLWTSGRPVCSVEFFPPKNEETAKQFLLTADRLKGYRPDFVSMTYGAGGSSRDRSIGFGQQLRKDFGYEVLPHLTCVGHSRSEIDSILNDFRDSGFQGIMALRGDPPQGESTFEPHPDGLRYATDLVRFIQEKDPSFALGVAGYPEKHPESPSAEEDLRHLVTKVSAGADFITTQLFFDNEDYFRFVANCRKAGISIPILPGILTAVSWKQVTRFCGMCGSRIPPKLAAQLEEAAGDPAKEAEVGINWAKNQVIELLQSGAPGFHLYILNRSKPALELMHRLDEELGSDFRSIRKDPSGSL